MKAMIFAAGLGTRLKPFTNNHPKALAVVNGKTLLQRNIEYLQQFGIREVIVNVHHFAEQIIDALSINKGWGSQVTISNEIDSVLETGGGLKKAADYLKNEDNFLVMNADILANFNLDDIITYHKQNNVIATLAVMQRNTSRYLLQDNTNALMGWKNTQTHEEKGPVINLTSQQKEALIPVAFCGVQILNNRIFSLLPNEQKFSIIDAYLNICATERIALYNYSSALFVDVGKPENIAVAEQLFT